MIVVRAVDVAETRPLRQAVLRPHGTVAQLAEHEPPDPFAAGGFSDEELIAVGLIGRDGPSDPPGPAGPPASLGSWRVRGMATAPAHRGHGAGSAVLGALLEHATAHGATRIWCNARTPARSFYLRTGFQVSSEEFELPDIGPHVVMELLVPSAQ